MTTRRDFLRRGAGALAGVALARPAAAQAAGAPPHVLFEYYPWYRSSPWVHWDQWGRVPPDDLASNYVPALGAYDSVSLPVLEQHARWIAQSGAHGIDLSWWGPGSLEDRAVPVVMDVMHEHGLKVAFHLEPYGAGRTERYAEDVAYLVREYGDRRHWDAMLLLRTADGRIGPVFKSFATILLERTVDCHGVEGPVDGYAPDAAWRRQTDAVRETLRRDFDRVWLLADSLELARTPASGFDGISIYDPFVEPSDWVRLATEASRAGLLSTFAVNPGFDGIGPREVEPGSCYQPTPFEPGGARRELDFTQPEDRELAATLSRRRIGESFEAAVAVQTQPSLANAQQGVFLVYVNSFNEWHEGTAFEPMKDAAELAGGERVHGYHNPADGSYRMDTLRPLLQSLRNG